MKIDLLTLYNYRNYNNLNLKLSSNINIFTGFNALEGCLTGTSPPLSEVATQISVF